MVYDFFNLFGLWCFFVLVCLDREEVAGACLVRSPLERARLTMLGASFERTLEAKALSHWSSTLLTAYLHIL